jgi:hypothetical protein
MTSVLHLSFLIKLATSIKREEDNLGIHSRTGNIVILSLYGGSSPSQM